MAKRIYYDEIPFIRAIACLMVVLVHVTAHNYNYSLGQFSDPLSLMLNQLSRLGTPLFAAISAFLLFSSVRHRGFKLSDFFLSRTVKIVLPFVIWTFAYLVYRYTQGADVFSNVKNVLLHLVLGTGFSHLYFVATVIQFYLLFPLLQRVRKRNTLLILFAISLPVNAVWLVPELRPSLGLLETVTAHRSFILQWISYFLFGGLLAYYYEEWKAFVLKYKFAILAAFTLVGIGLAIEIRPDRLLTSSRPMNLLYIPITFLSLLWLYTTIKTKTKLVRSLEVIGNYSMGIYLVHPFVLIILRKYMPPASWEPVFIGFSFLLTVGISLLLLRILAMVPFARFIVPIGTSKPRKKDPGMNTPYIERGL